MNVVALTGASGFIGRYLCEKLAAERPEIKLRNLDLERPTYEFSGEFIQGDIRDASACDQLVSGADVVINLAAAHKDFGIEKEEYFDVNERGTDIVLQAMGRAGVNRMIFTSSVAVYNPNSETINEDSVPDPQNPYGASKLAAEKVMEKWLAEDGNRSAFVVRPTVVIGPRNRATMFSLIDQIVKGKYVFNLGAGANVKSLAVVQNLVSLICQKLTFDGNEAWQLTNFVDGPQMPTRKIIETIHDALGKKMPGISIPVPVASMMALPIHWMARMVGKHSPITPARIRKLALQTRFDSIRLESIGYQPQLTTEQGIREMVKWYQAEVEA